MKVFGCIFTYVLIVTEAVLIALKICDPGWETYIFIGISFLFGIFALAAVSDSDNAFSFIGRVLLSLIIIPFMTTALMFIAEVIIWLVKTFTVKGVFGLGIIAAIIITILSSCVFIFFI